MKQVRIEYADSWMDTEVPESAVVVRPGGTFSEPKPLEDPVEATRQALAEPLGSPPVGELVGPGAKVAVAFPDRVKGGFHAISHRRATVQLLKESTTRPKMDNYQSAVGEKREQGKG